MHRASIFALSVAILFFPSLSSAGDAIQLANGDTVTGHVVSLDEKQIKIKSDLLGELTIDRKNVRVIQLHDAAPEKALENSIGPKAPAGAPPAAGNKKSASLDDLLKQLRTGGAGGPIDAEALLKKLEAEGGNDPAIAELKKNMPLLGAPQVQGYVDKQLKGLIDGSLQIGDIRKDAIRARDETRKAIRDLGPGAEEALAPYLGILDKFIKETTPPAEKPVKAK